MFEYISTHFEWQEKIHGAAICTRQFGGWKILQLYQKILQEAGEHPERNYLVIVPEQFTMQTQKELVSLSPRHGIMNVDILSFDRLAHRVFAEVGGDQTPVLEDVGKILVLERVVQEQKKKLGVLGSSLEKLGTVSEMKSLLSELMQYDIHPEELDEIGNLAKDKPLLYHKLKDVQTIYQGFSEFLRNDISRRRKCWIFCVRRSEAPGW
mgnify:CR=1 FL=1